MSDIDFKALYHNPDELTRDELRLLRRKIQMQMMMPWFCGVSSAATMFAFRAGRLTPVMMASTFVAGYYIGKFGATSTSNMIVSRDEDIMRAWDKRQIRQVFAVSGLNSNYTSLQHNEEMITPRVY